MDRSQVRRFDPKAELGAAVTLYGGGIMKANPFLPFPALVDDVPTMKTPWLGMYGVEDHGIPQDEVDALEKETAAAPVETRLIDTSLSHADQSTEYPATCRFRNSSELSADDNTNAPPSKMGPREIIVQ